MVEVWELHIRLGVKNKQEKEGRGTQRVGSMGEEGAQARGEQSGGGQ